MLGFDKKRSNDRLMEMMTMELLMFKVFFMFIIKHMRT